MRISGVFEIESRASSKLNDREIGAILSPEAVEAAAVRGIMRSVLLWIHT
jgi:tRNA threonylcarbamoyladenosine modification (KEOPS) complex  Pcc1 subunit